MVVARVERGEREKGQPEIPTLLAMVRCAAKNGKGRARYFGFISSLIPRKERERER